MKLGGGGGSDRRETRYLRPKKQPSTSNPTTPSPTPTPMPACAPMLSPPPPPPPPPLPPSPVLFVLPEDDVASAAAADPVLEVDDVAVVIDRELEADDVMAVPDRVPDADEAVLVGMLDVVTPALDDPALVVPALVAELGVSLDVVATFVAAELVATLVAALPVEALLTTNPGLMFWWNCRTPYAAPAGKKRRTKCDEFATTAGARLTVHCTEPATEISISSRENISKTVPATTSSTR